MPSANTQFVTWASRRRRQRSGSALLEIAPPSRSMVSAGNTFQPTWAAPSISWERNTRQATFAFWSITGAQGGSIISTDNQPPPVQMGNQDITARAWYIESHDGPPNGEGPGVVIDAFDVQQGTFVDDDFVTVTPDARLTAAANADGWVPTTSAENVNAFADIHRVPFEDWMIVMGHEIVSGNELQAAVRTSAVAFAFYRNPSAIIRPVREAPPWRILVGDTEIDGAGGYFDASGRFHPIPIDPTLLLQLATGLSLAETAGRLYPELQSSVMDLAMKQLTLANEAIAKGLQAGFEPDVIKKDDGEFGPK